MAISYMHKFSMCFIKSIFHQQEMNALPVTLLSIWSKVAIGEGVEDWHVFHICCNSSETEENNFA